jgi:hypothetical protein
VPCLRLDEKACCQSVAPLPEMSDKSPSFFRLDYGGPLYCVDLPGRKLYILFTCAVLYYVLRKQRKIFDTYCPQWRHLVSRVHPLVGWVL